MFYLIVTSSMIITFMIAICRSKTKEDSSVGCEMEKEESCSLKERTSCNRLVTFHPVVTVYHVPNDLSTLEKQNCFYSATEIETFRATFMQPTIWRLVCTMLYCFVQVVQHVSQKLGSISVVFRCDGKEINVNLKKKRRTKRKKKMVPTDTCRDTLFSLDASSSSCLSSVVSKTLPSSILRFPCQLKENKNPFQALAATETKTVRFSKSVANSSHRPCHEYRLSLEEKDFLYQSRPDLT